MEGRAHAERREREEDQKRWEMRVQWEKYVLYYRLRNGIMSVINAEEEKHVMGRRTRRLFTCSETINRPARFACFLLQPSSSLPLPFSLAHPRKMVWRHDSLCEDDVSRRRRMSCATTFMSHTYIRRVSQTSDSTNALCISQERSVRKNASLREREGRVGGHT